MLINIEEVKDQELISKALDFEKKGGRLLFRTFRIKENYEGRIPEDKYECHLVVARQTIEIINFESNYHLNRACSKGNRTSLPILKTDFDDLDHSGEKIKVEEFLGCYYDLEKRKPIIRGSISNSTNNSYFYFDQEETDENKFDINQKIREFESKYPSRNGNFVHAFMEPPYSIQTGKTIKEKGDYLIDFMNYFFSDFNRLEIMKWSTDCSDFFNAGKEWWGTYFWTVYNPNKDWYVGICGSETD